CVCPGFIDLHTHYDAQYTWDPYATSSIWHGVTTTVIGNCGFAIAPCRPQDREVTLRTLVKVEGMSLKAMQAGITWEFETFPAYLDALERYNPSLNVAALLGHSAVRQWVMGRAAQRRGATGDEVAQMADVVREAMAAGAIGLGSSTAEAHVGDGGLPVPSRLADLDELKALTRAMGAGGRGLLEITVGSTTTLDDLRDIHRESGRPVVWAAFFHRDDRPEETTERLARTEAFHREGVDVRPQVSCRPLTMDFTMWNPYPFEAVGDLITHPRTLVSLSDAGAHLSLLCDAGYSTTLLGKWVRQKQRLSLEAAVRRLTWDPARAYRIPERGLLAPGYWADLVAFDPDTVDALPAEWVHDLPAGEPRFVSRARGIAWSLVNGVPVLEHGEIVERQAGARPGRILRAFES